ncbi:MAG: phenylalanine--tRNA ligase subunit beta [Anaerolineae bacterium]
MKLVWSWLAEHVDLSGVTPEHVAERLTVAGLEVDKVERIGDWWDRERLVVGNVLRVLPHPDAERLVLADVDWGAGSPHRVVTGAPNLLPFRGAGDFDRPMKVVFAREGAELFDGHAEGWVKVKLKGRPVRGVMSDAMVCSEKEIGLSEDHEGILILDDDAPVGAPIADVLGDAVLTLELTANYAHASNIVGMAREVAALLDRPFAPPEWALGDEDLIVDGGLPPAQTWCRVVIDDAEACPRYSARIIAGVDATRTSPAWLGRRLRLSGMRPINAVVDATNYAMLLWGEPLHAFDYDVLKARTGRSASAGAVDGGAAGIPTITVRRSRPGERMTTLDGVDRALDAGTILITDDAGPIAIAGVMGGAETEVTDATRTILLEAATFHFPSIRRASRDLKLPSESSWRFSRDVPPALIDPGSAVGARLIAEHAGGRVAPGIVDVYPRPRPAVDVVMALAEIDRLLGAEIPVRDIEAIQARLGFAATVDGDTLAATVPPHRVDVALPADIVEEVVRVWGLDRLPSTPLADALPVQLDNRTQWLEEATRDACVGAGLQEIVSYRMTSIGHERGTAAGGPAADAPDEAAYVAIANAISPERSVMRQSMLTGLLDAAATNLRHSDRAALFEVGSTYHWPAGTAPSPTSLPAEPRHVALLLAGLRRPADWRGGEVSAMDFYDAKGVVESLLDALGVGGVTFAPATHPSMHPGRTAVVRAAAPGAGEAPRIVGHVGELHPVVRDRWDLPAARVAVADIDLEAVRPRWPAPSGRSPRSARTPPSSATWPSSSTRRCRGRRGGGARRGRQAAGGGAPVRRLPRAAGRGRAQERGLPAAVPVDGQDARRGERGQAAGADRAGAGEGRWGRGPGVGGGGACVVGLRGRVQSRRAGAGGGAPELVPGLRPLHPGLAGTSSPQDPLIGRTGQLQSSDMLPEEVLYHALGAKTY